jgi:hypothetical protein
MLVRKYCLRDLREFVCRAKHNRIVVGAVCDGARSIIHKISDFRIVRGHRPRLQLLEKPKSEFRFV